MRQLLLSTVVALGWAAVPVLANDERDCFQQKDPQLRIVACSDIIRRDPNDATAYHNRAVGYGLSGDTDRAIADYSKAIELSPDSAAAYDNRGRAYASKGDYPRALADVTKAGELVAKAATGSIAPKAAKTMAIAPKTATSPAKSVATARNTKPISQPNIYVKKQTLDDWPKWAAGSRDKSRD